MRNKTNQNKKQTQVSSTLHQVATLRKAQFTPFLNLLKRPFLPQCLQLTDSLIYIADQLPSSLQVSVSGQSLWSGPLENLNFRMDHSFCTLPVARTKSTLRDLLAYPVCNSSSLGFSLITSTLGYKISLRKVDVHVRKTTTESTKLRIWLFSKEILVFLQEVFFFFFHLCLFSFFLKKSYCLGHSICISKLIMHMSWESHCEVMLWMEYRMYWIRENLDYTKSQLFLSVDLLQKYFFPNPTSRDQLCILKAVFIII